MICSEEKARQLGKMDRAVKVRASVMTSDPYQERNLQMPDELQETQADALTRCLGGEEGIEDLGLDLRRDTWAIVHDTHHNAIQFLASGAGQLGIAPLFQKWQRFIPIFLGKQFHSFIINHVVHNQP